MKFLHTGDLHIGKNLHEFSLLEDQKYILDQIRQIAGQEQVQAVVIAGDVYDRAIPSAEAVELLDDFLTGILADGISVIMISGNHDCGQRVAFADRILEKQGLHISGEYEGELKQVTFQDDYGPVTFVCLPFVKPAQVGAKTSGEAVQRLLEAHPMTLDLRTRHVLVTHFFVTGEQGEEPLLSDSETAVSVGGLDNVPAGLFGQFDYVALGHIHRPQQIGRGQIYYAGSPLKYSFSEAAGCKSVQIVTLEEKGQVLVEKRALSPLRDLRIVRGKLTELLEAGRTLGEEDREAYVQAVLTDETELLDPIGMLRSVYPNVMQILLEKNLKEQGEVLQTQGISIRRSLEELFGEFYEMLKGEELDEHRARIVRQAAREAER